ncbi:DUF1937 family protein [Rhodobacter capsulatus]|uniref:DUF1937 family protein n=1 Tax=Rhodobacter capsulatus TaxID=1061 RepID=UPI00402920F2
MSGSAINWGPVLDPEGAWSPPVHVGASPEVVARHNSGLAYLATPYTKEVLVKGKWSFERSVMLSTLASRHVLLLMRAGATAVSPIVLAAEALHAQPSVPGRKVSPLDRARWTEWCRPMFCAAQLVVVPNIPGWDRSEGIWADVQAALAHNTPVFIYGGGR